MPKASRKLLIARRLANLRQRMKIDTQEIRSRTLADLKILFDLAVSLAKGEVKTQTENGRTVKVTLKQRQIWARVAAYVAQIINSIAEGFDEREVDIQLDELERLVNEAKAKTEAQEAQRGDAQPGEQ